MRAQLRGYTTGRSCGWLKPSPDSVWISKRRRSQGRSHDTINLRFNIIQGSFNCTAGGVTMPTSAKGSRKISYINLPLGSEPDLVFSIVNLSEEDGNFD